MPKKALYHEPNLGVRLKLARKAAMVTGEELAELIGVSRTQIANFESEYCGLTKANAIVISDKLGINLNWLLYGEEPMQGKSSSLNSGGLNKGAFNQAGNKTNLSEVERAELTFLRLKISYLEKERDYYKRVYEQSQSKSSH